VNFLGWDRLVEGDEIVSEDADFLFKILAAFLASAYAGIHGYFYFSRPKIEKVAVVQKGRMNFSYVLLFLPWVPLIIYWFSPWIDDWNIMIPSWIRWLGVLTMFCGNIGFLWAHQALGKNWSPVLEIQEGQQLVTQGPYRWIRHPMYGALFLIHLGIGMMTANGLVAPAFWGAVLTMYFLRVSPEEKMMRQFFGEAYRAYMEKTGRLGPRFGPPNEKPGGSAAPKKDGRRSE